MKTTLTRILTGVAIVGFSSVALADQSRKVSPDYLVQCEEKGTISKYSTCQKVDPKDIDLFDKGFYYARCTGDKIKALQMQIIALDRDVSAHYRRVPAHCEEV